MTTITPQEIERRLNLQRAAHAAWERLNDIAKEYADDPEQAHMRADGVLCGLLLQLGCQDVVDAYERVCKWYA